MSLTGMQINALTTFIRSSAKHSKAEKRTFKGQLYIKVTSISNWEFQSEISRDLRIAGFNARTVKQPDNPRYQLTQYYEVYVGQLNRKGKEIRKQLNKDPNSILTLTNSDIIQLRKLYKEHKQLFQRANLIRGTKS